MVIVEVSYLSPTTSYDSFLLHFALVYIDLTRYKSFINTIDFISRSKKVLNHDIANQSIVLALAHPSLRFVPLFNKYC